MTPPKSLYPVYVVTTGMSPTIGLSIHVVTLFTMPLASMMPVILYLPPTVNDTSVPPLAFFVVALLAMAALTNPCGVDQRASIRSSCASGFACAGGAGALPAGGATFQAWLPLTSWVWRCSPENGPTPP